MRSAIWHSVALAVSFALSLTPAGAQQPSTFDERALELVVMLTGEIAGEPTAGAGIVFGGKDGHLFIVTANHIVRRGAAAASNLQVRFRTHRDTPMPARLASNFDPALDLAVLAIERADRHGPDICDLPITLLGHPDSLGRGVEVYPVGYPNGMEWAMPVTADRLAEVRGDLLTFQSVFIARGHSGGALLTGDGQLVGLIREDQPPFGRALHMGKVIEVLRGWGYPVALHVEGALHRAAAQGHVGEMRFLIAGGCGILEEQDNDRFTALHWAAVRDQLDAVQLLLDLGADANGGGDGETPLYLAAGRASPALVKRLLAAGADPLRTDRYRQRHALEAAANRGRYRTRNEAGFCIDPRCEEDVAIVRMLLAAGADVNVPGANASPLHSAASSGHVEVVRELLDAGADLNDPRGFHGNASPLLHALSPASDDDAQRGQHQIAKMLIEYGADVNKRSDPGATALHFAIARVASIEIVEMLIAAGADVNLHGFDGQTPLHSAVYARQVEIGKLLLERGADVNARDDQGRTPLFWARIISEPDPAIIRLLLAHGAQQ
jgi:ankyrin repeat protein